MKKLISIGAGVMLAVAAFATGNEGVNPPQGGVLTPANGVTSITNQFAFPFQTTPLMVVYAGATNSTPITNSITTTNFTLSYPVNGSTNASFVWQAFVGGTKMCFGSQALTTASTNVTFPFAYAAAPSVVLGGNSTNGIAAITAITTTNFTLTSTVAQTNSWQAIGSVYNPQTEYQGNFPVNNKVLTP